MHLTNYAINKESETFQANESEFKKGLQETLEMIKEQEIENGNDGEKIVADLWA